MDELLPATVVLSVVMSLALDVIAVPWLVTVVSKVLKPLAVAATPVVLSFTVVSNAVISVALVVVAVP